MLIAKFFLCRNNAQSFSKVDLQIDFPKIQLWFDCYMHFGVIAILLNSKISFVCFILQAQCS